jgi:SAM-dependent methyltransferase
MQKDVIENEIKKAYGFIAENRNAQSCCQSTSCCNNENAADYSSVKGYEKEADLALGCGLPTEIANIKKGDTVIDLGSGAGNDVFIARSIVGESGKVIGVDITPEMINRAVENNNKFAYKNVEFLLGEIENLQEIPDNTADVVISNCVMNLVHNKEKAFSEVYRTLKTGGHFSISDIVYEGYLPDGVLKSAEMYASCISGASEKRHYLDIIEKVGFQNIQIKNERPINLPDSLLLKYISPDELNSFKRSDSAIFSVTIYAEKLDKCKCCAG